MHHLARICNFLRREKNEANVYMVRTGLVKKKKEEIHEDLQLVQTLMRSRRYKSYRDSTTLFFLKDVWVYPTCVWRETTNR